MAQIRLNPNRLGAHRKANLISVPGTEIKLVASQGSRWFLSWWSLIPREANERGPRRRRDGQVDRWR
jgi:hypothetical protein